MLPTESVVIRPNSLEVFEKKIRGIPLDSDEKSALEVGFRQTQQKQVPFPQFYLY